MIRAGAVALLAVVVMACANPNEVRGVVIEVTGTLTTVESFVLRTDGGEMLTIVPAADGDFSFPLPHLNDHRRSFSPVLVELDRSTNPPTATSIRDADNPDWHE